MHTIYTLSTAAVITLFINGCSGHTLQDWADKEFNDKEAVIEKPAKVETTRKKPVTTSTPSQNQELHRVSPMPVAASEGGAMQESLDKWTEEEWTPIVEQDEKMKKVNQDEERPFKIQEYVDKAMIYHANKPESGEPSHKEHLDTLPVIGK
jgi:hypothetical protein